MAAKNGTVGSFFPLPWQRVALTSILMATGTKPALFAWAGGKGSGKSIMLCLTAVILAHTRPGAEIAVCMDSYPSIRDIHMPFLSSMCPGMDGTYHSAEHEWRFKNGSVIRLRHLDMPGDPQSGQSPLEGGNYHAILADECQKVDSRYWLTFRERARVQALDVRGVMRAPVIICSGLPISTWWCAHTLLAGGMVWRPKTRENTHNAPGYEAGLRASMTESRARAMLDGEELAPEGAIYAEYRRAPYPEGNLTPEGWVPKWQTSRVIISADLGIRCPAAILGVQDDDLGAWIITHEWAPDNATIGDLCRMIRVQACPRKEWRGPQDPRIPIDMVITDPAGQARSAQTGSSDLDLFAQNPPDGLGMRPVVERNPDRRGVVDGIVRMQLALEKRKLLFSQELIASGTSAPGEQRTLARSLLGYSWDPRDPSRPKKDGIFDHHCDAVRYFCREVLWTLGDLPRVSAWSGPNRGWSDPNDYGAVGAAVHNLR